MSGKRAYRGARFGSKQSSSRQSRGLFKDNVWYCNCEPQRFPAEHFETKKEGPNKGRWFYTCQQREKGRCDFFLWDDDAAPRMKAAVFDSNSESTSGRRASDQEGWDAGRSRPHGTPSGRNADHQRSSPPPAHGETTDHYINGKGQQHNALKRGASAAGFNEETDDEESFEWPLTRDDEADLIRAADTGPNTPHKMQKTGVYATPQTELPKAVHSSNGPNHLSNSSVDPIKRKLPWQEDSNRSGTTAARSLSFLDIPCDIPSTAGTAHDPQTPIGNRIISHVPPSPLPEPRYRNALSNPNDANSTLATEVFEALDSVNLSAAVSSDLRSILTKHDLRTQGVVKGRDISRLAIKAKDAKIAELHAKIASLEAEQEFRRQMRAMYGTSAEDEAQSTQASDPQPT